MANRKSDTRPRGRSAKSLSGLLPFLRPYRGRIALALVFLVAAAATTLVLPIALRQLIDTGMGATGATGAAGASGASPDPAAIGSKLVALRGHFAALFGVAAAMGVFSALRYYTVTWLGERVTADLRSAVYAHVVRQSPEFFESTRTGEVLSRLTTDTTLVQAVVGSSLSLGLRNTVMGVGALVMLVVTNPTVMMTVLGVLLLVVAPAMLFGRRVRRLSRDSQDRVADSSAIAGEVLNAIPVVQSHVQEVREAERFERATQEAFEVARRRTMVRALLVAFIIIGTAGAMLWGLFQGTQAVIAGRVSPGHLGQTILYVIVLVGSVTVLSEVWGDLLRAAGATERLMELLHARSPVRDPVAPVALATSAGPAPAHSASPEDLGSARGNAHPEPGHGAPASRSSESRRPARGLSVDFDQVTFAYPSRPTMPSLIDFSLHVAPGETVALVGPSGAGKSTVLQLLLRFYDAQQGSVRIDGVNVQDMRLADLRRRLALVAQESTIFSATVLDNIRYARPDASVDAVREAARQAHALEFIEALPEGFDTHVGERGVRLSGGQRQRVAIARAMLLDPPLLLLDEATSALDAASERAVQQALEAAMQDRTTIVIAHRLATVLRADRIVVLDQGRIIDIGTHAELVSRGGLYARLATLQFDTAAAIGQALAPLPEAT